MSGRRSAEWLSLSFRPDQGGERRAERRGRDRRAPQRKLDPLFAATLINQIMPAEAPAAPAALAAYRAGPRLDRPRTGVLADLRS